ANNLKPFDYFEYLLTEIPKHVDDKNIDFLAELLPWSDMLPENIRKPQKASGK
ncbi:transposase domain-containing protein, partial [Fusicatenibacter saccharivorans]